MATWASPARIINPAGAPEQFDEEYTSQYDYTATKDDELSLRVGMRLLALKKEEDGWWFGKSIDGTQLSGWFPSTYVKKSSTPSPKASSTPSQSSDKIMIARSLYPYAARYPGELTIEQYEQLDIIEDPPNEPDWWLARNSDGKTGLVPKNYVEKQPDKPISHSNYDHVTPLLNEARSTPVRERIPPTGTKSNGSGAGVGNSVIGKSWFYGDIDRTAAVNILKARASVGEFLVRNCSGGEKCISVRAPTGFRHFKVKVLSDDQYGIGQKRFPTMDALFEYYTKAPIFTSAQEKVFLTHPLPS